MSIGRNTKPITTRAMQVTMAGWLCCGSLAMILMLATKMSLLLKAVGGLLCIGIAGLLWLIYKRLSSLAAELEAAEQEIARRDGKGGQNLGLNSSQAESVSPLKSIFGQL